MRTFQDLEQAQDKPKFIFDAITEYKASAEYLKAETGYSYYKGENIKILSRLNFLQRIGINLDVTFHKLRNQFFPKATKQVVFYTIGNGLTMDEAKKQRFGKKFEKQLIQAAIYSFWGGVAWLFPNLVKDGEYNVKVFSPLEAFGLFDEYDGSAKALIRFWQIDDDKPMMIEFYTIDGLTKYRSIEGKIEEVSPLMAYKLTINKDIISEEIVSTDNYPSFPCIPMYANMLHKSEFSDALKESIDAYDFINSDLIDGIIQVDGAYWDIINCAGQEAEEIIQTIQKWKAVIFNDDKSGAKSNVIESPYLGKQAALESLLQDMYDDFMALNIKAIQGGSLTNVAINVAKTDLDLKADELEWQIADVVENIMELLGIEWEEPRFSRRSITNDTEIINNISTQLSDGSIDLEEAVFLSPNILESRKSDLLERLEASILEKADAVAPIEVNDGRDTQIE